jgi:hypothetical protein
VSGCHYHDLELASAGDGDAGDAGGGGGERARRLDFQAKRAVGGHKERLLEGACYVLGTHFQTHVIGVLDAHEIKVRK